ncbi:cca1p [Saccharomyces arboricola H-6]|uniref:CCA tRNA nucleotidyltransferase, mitochondrial n=1 Tax=Saccharomyces arboricola (strain H-6 / AS 2.3317 / CBS 10644) TaxID=1160507 RepID=J8Q8L5_SACAR|nr:cca1p [Saccharomyces arboricola H-6]
MLRSTASLLMKSIPQKAMTNPIFTLQAPKITLTKVEQNICNLLNDYTDSYNREHQNKSEPLTLRITGGWVRDKLLGQGSHDLDIAINVMSGEQFATGLNEYLQEHHAKYGAKPHNIHKIDKNPEKSKHLETATTKLFGIEVDFVNLRSEKYTELSRIPKVCFGTPEEDALRRDATLNALFYNIQEGEVEDFTRRGLRDLKDGVLRTPLPAKQTFLDDPLRVLRLIRFASRFNFAIDPEVMAEMGDPQINSAFNSKISRERVGVEMEKILVGPTPLLALQLIQKAHLDNVIFFWHNDKSVVEYNEKNCQDMEKINHVYNDNILNSHLQSFIELYPMFLEKLPVLREKIGQSPSFQQNFILSATLTPLANLQIIGNPKKKVNNLLSITESIVKEGLKLSKNDAVIIAKTVDSVSSYQEIAFRFTDRSQIQKSEIGLFLRNFNGTWETVHFTSLLDLFLKLPKSDPKKIESLFQNYNAFYSYIFDNNLSSCHELKPIVDGKQMAKLLQMKPGPWLGKINNEAIRWQFDNPEGTDAELIAHLKALLPNYL